MLLKNVTAPSLILASATILLARATRRGDWGTPPKMCRSVRVSGTTNCGTVKDPDGLKGTYCSSFIAEVRLQGSGILNGGQDIQYNAGTITKVDSIKSADGTPVAADHTVARDRSIISRA